MFIDTSDIEVDPNEKTPLQYAVTHVFLPVQPPGRSDYTLDNDLSLFRTACATARHYATVHIHGTPEEDHWHRITRMLVNLQASVESMDGEVISQLRGMCAGDGLAFFVRPQNVVVLLSKGQKSTVCESFELSPSKDTTERTLQSRYPELAVEMANGVFDSEDVQTTLAHFLYPRSAKLDLPYDGREYIAALRAHISRGVDCTLNFPYITKHVRDHAFSRSDRWHRSSLWLLIRITIQLSFDRSRLGRVFYKRFMLFFVCTIAKKASEVHENFSNGLLYLMACKILRRSSKLGQSVPDWLSKIALTTCASLRETLDARWRLLDVQTPQLQTPSQDMLARDKQLSMSFSGQYIRDALANRGHKQANAPFRPNDRRRGTIEDFLSSDGAFFETAYHADPQGALYDVGQSVGQGIDDWFTQVTDVDDACTQLGILMERYMIHAEKASGGNPEATSITLLTAIELFVALDKLVVRKMPMFADYSPEIPLSFLETFLLRTPSNLHRLSRAYQYLSARHSQSHPGWSVFSDEFTENSFGARFYDQSQDLQYLKAYIDYKAERRHLGCQERAGDYRSPLPSSPTHAKVVVFELGCPVCLCVWRTSVLRILPGLGNEELLDENPARNAHDIQVLARVPALTSHFIRHKGPKGSLKFHLAYTYLDRSQSQSPSLCYVTERESRLAMWRKNVAIYIPWLTYDRGPLGMKYVASTSHTSNDVLASQADCPADLSPTEFIAFGQLRSHGGSLQWLNILHGLRSRTLNLQHHQVHYLLSQASSQAGPLDLNTGTWIWHQELQDVSFCVALLDELDSLLMEVGGGSIDAVLMNTISLLLTRVLASSPSGDITERTIGLLRNVRRRTFKWMKELLYNLKVAPLKGGRSILLLEMAATCRSTYDVDTALHKACDSMEDVDILLSCALLIRTLYPGKTLDLDGSSPKPTAISNPYLLPLLYRDYCLSNILEGILRDLILADPSDYGVDLAVGKVFTRHYPGPRRWGTLKFPNAHWLTCKNGVTECQSLTMGQFSANVQTIHINLLNGKLRVDGQLIDGLLHVIKDFPEYQRIFHDQGFFVIPSNRPGMDFETTGIASKNTVHFSVDIYRHIHLQAQCNTTGDIVQLLPENYMYHDLPPALARGHLHWLNLRTGIIEVRPFRRPWEESSENWRINCVSRGEYYAYKGREFLVDVRSPTWKMVSEHFHCLNNVFGTEVHSRNLLVTVSPVGSSGHLRLSVVLPHYELSFFVNECGEFESCDFKDMVYDKDRHLGTLSSLQHLLVLRPKTHISGTLIPKGLISRRVLIPNGLPTKRHKLDAHKAFSHGQDDHSRIAVGEARYHSYSVDTELGCLRGDNNLESMEYLVYLHVMTSCHQPDSLTGKTGIQEALCLLQSAGCRSILKLKTLDKQLPQEVDPLPFSGHPQILSPYLQLIIAYGNGRYRYYQWNADNNDLPYHNHMAFVTTASEQYIAQRAAYLFPWEPGTADSAGYDVHHGFNEAPWPLTLEQLFSDRSPPELPRPSTLRLDEDKRSLRKTPGLGRLFSSLQKIKNPDLPFQERYIALLEHSSAYDNPRYTYRLSKSTDALQEYFEQCSSKYLDALDVLKQNLGPTNPLECALEQLGQWPPITANYLLRCLASTSQIKISQQWKACLISLALLLLDFQHARRLLRFALDGLEDEFSKELDNKGCDGWNAEDFPDWLLIQIQGNFLIRRTQAETAMEMTSPKSGENTILQLNIGEGKSSVIIPITAAALADGKQLVRVIVPKALVVQMFELMVARLGWLANRPVLHLPFSRTYQKHMERCSEIGVLRKLMPQCMAEGAIVLVQPEDVVSLRLKSVEEQICQDQLLGLRSSFLQRVWKVHHLPPREFRELPSEWLSLQQWIHSNARDILDESDDTLRPGFQLIYTIGHEQHVDGFPDRWTVTQQVLRLVKEHSYTLSKNHPDSIEYECGLPGSFPEIRIVQDSGVCQRLTSLILEDIMAGRLPDFNFCFLSPALQDAIPDFISNESGVLRLHETVKMVEEYSKVTHEGHLWKRLLLLRGLLASNVLLYALTKRRWRVDYGLDLQPRHKNSGEWGMSASTMLAVPYRAKDVPAPNTQFGHPDVTIILTCLSYYYAGLTKEQLRVAFEILLDQDDPSVEYALWVKEYDDKPLPRSIKKLDDINLRSSEQWDKVIFPLLSRNQVVVDFYLSRVVFPKEAKEFPWKICASSWDIAERREKPTTGFSGTSDGRWLLPTSVVQRNLDHQRGSHARILAYLLQSKNNSYMVSHGNGKRWSTLKLLRTVGRQTPEIRVLLDVGAQILDFSNRQVAEAWLYISKSTAGAIYFNRNDELVVLTRDGTTLPMTSSPLSQQLSRCVVYLDHAHTRGTDLKLPIGSRAAVTLGPRLTKDNLVQGCMRMRKLGHGHSVMFFAPLEVDLAIRAITKNVNAKVSTVDVLCWAIRETWTDIQQHAPYWAQQGMEHKMRHEAWSQFVSERITQEELASIWRQPGIKSLTDLYSPCEANDASNHISRLDPEIQQRCKTLGVLSLPSGQLEEEQEREVNREQERELQVERQAPNAKPAEHWHDPEVERFVKTGDYKSGAFLPVFTTHELGTTSASSMTGKADVRNTSILATMDFCETIIGSSSQGTIDQYLRPAQWVLTRGRGDPLLLLLSPSEVARLLPDIRASEYVHLHLYAPRTAQRMKSSDDLKLYSIPRLPLDWTPPWVLIDQLNVFSGQLYLRDHESYLRLCRFLGVATKESQNGSVVQRRIQWNLFGMSDPPQGLQEESTTLSSVRELLSMRGRGRQFAETHMGKILQGQSLAEKDFT